jgi:hypothetical protein
MHILLLIVPFYYPVKMILAEHNGNRGVQRERIDLGY